MGIGTARQGTCRNNDQVSAYSNGAKLNKRPVDGTGCCVPVRRRLRRGRRRRESSLYYTLAARFHRTKARAQIIQQERGTGDENRLLQRLSFFCVGGVFVWGGRSPVYASWQGVTVRCSWRCCVDVDG